MWIATTARFEATEEIHSAERPYEYGRRRAEIAKDTVQRCEHSRVEACTFIEMPFGNIRFRQAAFTALFAAGNSPTAPTVCDSRQSDHQVGGHLFRSADGQSRRDM